MAEKIAIKKGEFFLDIRATIYRALPSVSDFRQAMTSHTAFWDSTLYFASGPNHNGFPALVTYKYSDVSNNGVISFALYSVSEDDYTIISALAMPFPVDSGINRTAYGDLILAGDNFIAHEDNFAGDIIKVLTAENIMDGSQSLTINDFVVQTATFSLPYATVTKRLLPSAGDFGDFYGILAGIYDANSNNGILEVFRINSPNSGQFVTLSQVDYDNNSSSVGHIHIASIKETEYFSVFVYYDDNMDFPLLIRHNFDGFSVIFDELRFDDPSLNPPYGFDPGDNYIDFYYGFTDKQYFYFPIYTSISDPPFEIVRLLQVSHDWSEYSIINMRPLDTESATALEEFPTFGYSAKDNKILMTAGYDGPILYYIGEFAYPPSGGDRTTKRPIPIGLPCVVNCVPVIDRRIK